MAWEKNKRLGQRMTMHLNGGNKFSELHYVITLDGEDTKITRHTRTNGSPRYEVEADELHDGEDTFDMRKGDYPFEWIWARLEPKDEAHD